MSSTTALAPADGLQLAIDGILIEAQRTLEQRPADPHQLERVIELTELAQSIVVRKRRFELEDEGVHSVEDAFEEEGYDDCGAGIGYWTNGPAGIRNGRPRKRARQRGVRNANYAGVSSATTRTPPLEPRGRRPCGRRLWPGRGCGMKPARVGRGC